MAARRGTQVQFDEIVGRTKERAANRRSRAFAVNVRKQRMNLELEGKAFFVTGAASGIGAAAVSQLRRPAPTSPPAIGIAPAWINSHQNAMRCFRSAPTSLRDRTSFKPWKPVARNSDESIRCCTLPGYLIATNWTTSRSTFGTRSWPSTCAALSFWYRPSCRSCASRTAAVSC